MSTMGQLNENDALHILPLSNFPLQVQALKNTRLIKNTRLEGVIELFSDATTGSGQVTPDGLADIFDFSGGRDKDLLIVKKLADLQSYDVYSLRVSLKKANIEVDDFENLKLSKEVSESLTSYLSIFTRPLVQKIYGDDSKEVRSIQDILRLFTDPNADQTRKNLSKLAALLEVDLVKIPKFLEDYADMVLSLSFYQKCHKDMAPEYGAFMRDLEGLTNAPSTKRNPTAAMKLESAVETFGNLYRNVSNILVAFQIRILDMWKNISAQRYQKMTELVIGHQEKIGAILCAINVKLDAWRQYSASAATESSADKAVFVSNNMMYALDDLTGLKFQDA